MLADHADTTLPLLFGGGIATTLCLPSALFFFLSFLFERTVFLSSNSERTLLLRHRTRLLFARVCSTNPRVSAIVLRACGCVGRAVGGVRVRGENGTDMWRCATPRTKQSTATRLPLDFH